MKKNIPLLIKGILLSFLFVFAFNLNLGQLTYQTPDNSYVAQVSVEQFTDRGRSNILIPVALAQDENAEKPEKEVTELMQQAIKIINSAGTYVHRLFHPMINFFAFHTGNFLGTDYIYEGAMGDMLKRIWIVSRNVVNILFVLILLGLALKEIFWVKEEGSELKKSLIKFVLLLVAVNFSWMATKVVLDAANVATNVVFSIPMGVGSVGGGIKFDECDVPDAKTTTGLCYPTAIYAPVDTKDTKNYEYKKASECKDQDIEGKYSGNTDSAFDAKGEPNVNASNENKELQEKTTFCWGTIDFFAYNKNTSTIYLTYGMARIQNLVNASADTSLVQLSVGILFSLLLQTAYVIALLALFLALIVRMAFLWIFVAFSPVLIVLFYFGGYQKGIGEGEAQFSIEAFIKWAFVTVKVGAVFSVAFIMVSAGQALTLSTPELFENLGKTGVEVTGKLFKIKSLFMGMDTIQEFIWLLITLVILWGGVFAVLGKMPVVSVATNQINEYGRRAGKWLATTPYWAPIMPMIDPATGEFRFGSYASEYGKRFDIAEKLELAGKKYMRGEDYADLQKRARSLNNSRDQKILTDLWANGTGNEQKAKEFIGKLGHTLESWNGLSQAVRNETLNSVGGGVAQNNSAINSWLESAHKVSSRATVAGAAAPKTEAEKQEEAEVIARGVEKGEKAAGPAPGTTPGQLGGNTAEKGEGG